MLDFRTLPRDDNGIIQGRFRVSIAGMPREDLVNRAVEGGELSRLAAAMGADALRIELFDKPKPAPRRRGRSR